MARGWGASRASLQGHRLLPFGVALAIAGVGACTAHAPRRVDVHDDAARSVQTTIAQLADHSARGDAAVSAVEVHPDFTIAFIEFDDQGRLWSRAQLDLLDRTLVSEGARESYDGVSVVFFAHGWKHDAAVCDENVACFRTFLGQIASDLAAAARASPGSVRPSRVVGVYAGWRGRSISVPVLAEVSFWARKHAAERIGSGELVEVLTHLDQFVQNQNAGGRFRSGLSVVGHSLGGTMVYEALANVMKMRVVEALGRRATVDPEHNIVSGFGDVVMLVNPAFEASLYAPIEDLLALFDSFSSLQSPVLVIVESETDMPNQMWFPLGRGLDALFQRTGPRSARALLRTAVGNYEPFVTHRLEARPLPGDASPAARGFGTVSDCACRLPLGEVPEDESLLLRSFVASERSGALARERFALASGSCTSGLDFGRARLTCRPGVDPSRPFWVVRATSDVVRGHSGFFTSPFLSFVRHTILEARVKGAARRLEQKNSLREAMPVSGPE